MNFSKITQGLIIGLLMSPFLFPKALLPIMLVLLVVWFMEGQFSLKLEYLKKNKHFLTLPLLFLLFGLGLVYTENISYGFQKMETRLSLIILPVILPTLLHARWNENKEKYALWYIGAAVLGSLWCIVRGLIYYFIERNALLSREVIDFPVGYNYVFSSHLTGFIMHPGYYAIFVVMAIFLLANLWLYNWRKFLRFWSVLAMLTLLILIFLSYAKAALIVLVLLCGIFGFQLAYQMRKLIYLVYGGVTIVLVLAIFYLFVPNTQERIQAIVDVRQEQKLDPSSTESTQARVHAWKAARATFAKRPLFGFGTGDGNDALFDTYRQRGYTGPLSMELNAHNEYLQTGMALGFVGVFFLVLPLMVAMREAIRKKNFLLGSWAIATVLVFLFESYLNTMAGALFFSLFFSILQLMDFGQKKYSISQEI